MITMTLTNPDWTRDEIVRGWLDSEPQAVAEEAADTEIAHIINNVHKIVGSGWDYRDGEFTGTYLGLKGFDPVEKIMTLMGDAVDYAVEHIDEIRADAAA